MEEVDRLRQRVAELRPLPVDQPTALADASKAAGSAAVARKDLSLQQRATLKGHFKKVVDLQWSAADPMTLLTAAQDGKLLLWNVQAALRINVVSLESAWVLACGLSRSGRLAAAGGLDDTISVFKLGEPSPPTGPAEQRDPPTLLKAHEGYVSACRFIGDEEVVSSSGDSSIALWNVARGGLLRRFYGHGADVSSVDIKDDQELMVSGSVDGTARLWDHRVRNCSVGVFADSPDHDVTSVAFMPDGHSFAAASEDGSTRIYDVRARAAVSNLVNPNAAEEATSVAVSHQGRFVVTGYRGGMIRAWDVLTGDVAYTNNTPEETVSCVGVSSNGVGVAFGSFDNTVRVIC